MSKLLLKSNKQINLFEDLRATSQEAIDLTIESLNTYGKDFDHWQISFSGGKDSSTVVTLVCDLIKRKLIKRPKTLTVMYADTRQELPPLEASARQILKEVERRGFNTKIVCAPLDKRFWVYMLGRGVPPPNNNTLRWCTQQIKLNPMIAALSELKKQLNNKPILCLTGVRQGESAARDNRIAFSCSKNGGECGQGWFQRDLKFPTLAPILHWRVCHVWDWLMVDAPEVGFKTEILAECYGGDEAIELEARTGCIGCPLASRDLALENLIKKYPEKWSYLEPLKQIRQWHEWSRKFKNRHQQHDERNKNGKRSKNPNRKGPLTLDARKILLETILNIQAKCNGLKPNNAPKICLINHQEELRIRELIAAKTFPNKWTGEEALGNALSDMIASDGTVMPLLPLDWGAVGLEVANE
ncbi:MAG: phosphoadenosine phosphosulfate reductase family protein [Cyanobacteria bacterium P01_E01_bin.42]